MTYKNGFTIVELLAVLVIMASAGIVISMNMQGLESRDNNDNKIENIRRIEEAACSYVDKIDFDLDGNGKDRDYCMDTNECNITLAELIRQGYIDEDLYYDDEGHYYRDFKDDIIIEVRWIDTDKYKVKKCSCKIDGHDCIE